MSMTNATAAQRSVDEIIGDRVHQLMWRNLLTQIDFAPKLGIGQTALSHKLRGRRGWSAGDLVSASRFFGVSVDYLLGETENPHQSPDGGNSVGPAGIEPTTSTVKTWTGGGEVIQLFPDAA